MIDKLPGFAKRMKWFLEHRPDLAKSDIVAVGPASAQDVNAFYVLKKTANKYNLKKVSDLKKVAAVLR